MPLYEYKCASCGKVIEVMQRFSDEPLTVHADCGGALEKLISTSSLQFKGTGWYITDYARKGSGAANRDKNSSSEKGSSGSGGSESKTESGKTETKTSTSDSAPAKT